jgi:Fe-S cluster assembly protein SufD
VTSAASTIPSAAMEHPLIAQFGKFASARRDSNRVMALRYRAHELFVEQGFPTTRDEDWRFTNVAPLAKIAFRRAALGDATGAEARAAVSRLAYPGCALAVFVDGYFRPQLSLLAELGAGVTVGSLAQALERGAAGESSTPATPSTTASPATPATPAIAELGRHARCEGQSFVALNTAYFEDGAFLHVAKSVVAERPIQLLFLSSDQPARVSFPRNLFVVEENAQVTVLEHYASVGEAMSWSCGVTEIVARDRAVVDHYKLQRQNAAAFHVATEQIHCGRGVAVSSHALNLGAALARHDVNCILSGEGADANLNGLYLVNGTQHCDTHMRVEHAAPHCGSHELYKGILDGHARAVFNGRIFVHKGAQKTDAKQTNRNLLLSKDALVNTNPQLEIFADDVKCTHGSTVGQLDAEAVFYLRSRGIGMEAAKSLLTYAFASDLVERFKLQPLREELEAYLFSWLPMGDVVRDAV